MKITLALSLKSKNSSELISDHITEEVAKLVIFESNGRLYTILASSLLLPAAMVKRRKTLRGLRPAATTVASVPSRKLCSSRTLLLSIASPCVLLATFFHVWSQTSPISNSCRSMAMLDAWKASLFNRVMTLSKETDFRAGMQKEPEGPLRFSLFDPFDSCEEGSLARVGGDGDGTEFC